MEKRNIIESITEPSKQDIWLKDGKFLIFGNNGWESITSSSNNINEKPNEYNTLVVTDEDIVQDPEFLIGDERISYNLLYAGTAKISKNDDRIQDLDKIKYIVINTRDNPFGYIHVPYIREDTYQINHLDIHVAVCISITTYKDDAGNVSITFSISSTMPSFSFNLPIFLNEEQETQLVTSHNITLNEQELIQNTGNYSIINALKTALSVGCNRINIIGQGINIELHNNGIISDTNSTKSRLFSGVTKDADGVTFNVLVTLILKIQETGGSTISVLIELKEELSNSVIYAPDFKILPLDELDNDTLDLTRLYNIQYNLTGTALPLSISGIPTIYDNTDTIVVPSPITGTLIRCIKTSENTFSGESLGYTSYQKIRIINIDNNIYASIENPESMIIELSSEEETSLLNNGTVTVTLPLSIDMQIYDISNIITISSSSFIVLVNFSEVKAVGEETLSTTFIFNVVTTINGNTGLLSAEIKNITTNNATAIITFKAL